MSDEQEKALNEFCADHKISFLDRGIVVVRFMELGIAKGKIDQKIKSRIEMKHKGIVRTAGS